MAMISRRDALTAGLTAVPTLGLAAAATAQVPTAPQGARPGVTGATGVLETPDPALAACLLIKGKKQIEVCRFALEKLQDPDVKAFAQDEITEHETLKKKLQALGYDAPAPAGAAGAAPAAGQPATMALLTVGRFALPMGVSAVVDIDRQVGEQCVTTAKSELGKLQGEKFDKRFVGHQLDAHYDLFDHTVVFRKNASAEMAAPLDEARQIIERHIATCKQLMEKLEARK